jgi:hypothetical protein
MVNVRITITYLLTYVLLRSITTATRKIIKKFLLKLKFMCISIHKLISIVLVDEVKDEVNMFSNACMLTETLTSSELDA